jgi:cell division protein FtsN
MVKSNKILRSIYITLSLVLFAFVVIKAYDEYLFQINNRTLKAIKFDNEPYIILPTKNENQNEEVEKIISDFVTDNKYDITQQNIVKETDQNKSLELSDDKIIENEIPIENIDNNQEEEKDNLLQLGAFNNKENISEHVNKIKVSFPLLIKNKKFFVKNSDMSLYKLFIGPFKNYNEAKEFCSNLRKNGVSCFFVQF